jgi:hypothetical protein
MTGEEMGRCRVTVDYMISAFMSSDRIVWDRDVAEHLAFVEKQRGSLG